MFYPGPEAEVLALATLALASSRHAKVGWEMVECGIAIIEGPPGAEFCSLAPPTDCLS